MQVIVFTIYVIVRANSTDIDYVEEAFMHTPRTNANNIIHYRNDSDFYFSYGVKAFKGKRFDRAEKWLKRAIEASPNNALYLCQLSVLYTELGQFHKANDLLQHAVHVQGDAYPDSYYLLANNFAHLGLFDESKKHAEHYLKLEPQGDFNEEMLELLELLDHVSSLEDDDEFDFDDDELIIYQETAFYYLEREKWDEAIQILEELILLFPEYLPAKHEYAFALFEKGDQREALELELASFNNDPTSIHSRLNLIYFYNQLKDETSVNALFDTLRNVYPSYFELKLKMAITFAKIGKLDEALYRFRLIGKNRPKQYASYYFWYTNTLVKCGFEDEANELWQEGTRRHPFLKEKLAEQCRN